MENENKIVKWEPIANIPTQLYLEGLHDDYDGFRILLKGKNISDRLLKIHFGVYLGYRNVDESYRIKTLNENPVLSTQWPLFLSEDNDFTKWIISESLGIIDTSKLYVNYIICTPNDIVEIVTDEQPTVEWL